MAAKEILGLILSGVYL